MIEGVSWIVGALGLYLAIGVLFGLLCTGLLGGPGPARMDPAAQGMPLSARLLMLPGMAALWPVMLRKWMKRQAPPAA